MLKEELKKLPDEPGVYLMKNKFGEIIYVGKAINLKKRVKQYFQNQNRHSIKIKKMVENIDSFEYIVTDSELEALVLECNLIKEHRPKYNTMLKDDKNYPYIRVTIDETYPRVLFSRRRGRDKSKYFGPYPAHISETLELIHKVYKLRTCNRVFPRDIGTKRPCLNYQIGRCDGVCTGKISEEEYGRRIDEIIKFLSGDYSIISEILKEKMLRAAEKLEFEEAANYRDLMEQIKNFSDRQKINSRGEAKDRDVIAIARSEKEAVAQVFFIRGGRLIGREHFRIDGIDSDTREVIYSDFIKQYYLCSPFIPAELLLDVEPAEMELLTEVLSLRREAKVNIIIPKKGEGLGLVELAYKNASLVLNKDGEKLKRELAKTRAAMKELVEILGLDTEIKRIESYDISNINGFLNVGSMVVFYEGRPKKSDYRKFRIKTVTGANDYASMEEMLTRRFEHGREEKIELLLNNKEDVDGKFSVFPDLILMDGGKGQVNICKKVLDKLGISIAVAGLVKDDRHRTRGIYYNNIEQPIDVHGELFKLITRIQDETHRFAIEYHRSLRGSKQTQSILDDIKGIGKVRRRAIIKHFSSIEEISKASVEELKNIEGMNERAAIEVYEFFRNNKNK